jgi:hypothetical protein
MQRPTTLMLTFAVLGILGAGVCTWRMGENDSSRSTELPSRTAPPSIPAAPSNGYAETPAALSDLQQRRLTAKIAQLESRIEQLAKQQTNPSVLAERSLGEVPSLSLEERMERNRSRIQRIDRALESEPHDGRWSMDTSRVLEDLFVSVVPSGSSLSQTTCGETFCRLIVRHENRRARDEFEVFPRKVPGMGVRGLIEENEDGTGQTTLYVVRKEYDTPEHPVRVQDSTG